MAEENKMIRNIGVQNYNMMETSRGVAYSARLVMDGQEVGFLENRGDGGITNVRIDKNKEEFDRRVAEYFNQIGLDLTGVAEYAIYYTFTAHLLDVVEEGEVSDQTLEIGIHV